MKRNKIARLLTISILAVLINGCSNGNVSSAKPKNKTANESRYEHSGEGIWGSINYKIEERTIDNCQYIIIFGSDGRNIIHKGNCRNIIHDCQK